MAPYVTREAFESDLADLVYRMVAQGLRDGDPAMVALVARAEQEERARTPRAS